MDQDYEQAPKATTEHSLPLEDHQGWRTPQTFYEMDEYYDPDDYVYDSEDPEDENEPPKWSAPEHTNAYSTP
jgi:hypothetical protein